MKMYKNGYSIKAIDDNTYRLRKTDFAADISHTNRAFHTMLESIRNIPLDEYPLTILDLDNNENVVTKLNSKEEFEYWILNNIE